MSGPDGPSLLLIEAAPDAERLAGTQGVLPALRQHRAGRADRLGGADLVQRSATVPDGEEHLRFGAQACCPVRPLHGSPPLLGARTQSTIRQSGLNRPFPE